MSIQDDEIPLKPVTELNEIESYLDSTEKSVLLIDLCGWSAKLAPKRTNESYDTSSLSNESDRGPFSLSPPPSFPCLFACF